MLPEGGHAMTSHSTLLSHLARNLTARTEDLAVEALGYILGKSPASREFLNSMVGNDIPRVVRVATQVIGEDRTRPDLVGFDGHGQERVLIEAKFWAALTENQPNTYLERLPDDDTSLLLFVAPEARLQSLWPELLRRTRERWEVVDGQDKEKVKSAALSDDGRRLMLTSWRHLLGVLAAQATAGGEMDVQAEIQQLVGLTEREDADAFLPIRREELGPEVPRRWLNLMQLMDDVVQEGREAGWIDVEGLGLSRSFEYYGRYMRVCGNPYLWFGIHFRWWANGETPLWVEFHADDAPEDEMLNKIRLLEQGEPGCVDEDWYVPIHLPTGVERAEVLDAVLKRVEFIGRTMNPSFGD